MAHNIYFNKQRAEHSFFSVKEKAWHRLGKIVDQYPTSSEALRFAGLDYTVEKRKLFTFDSENQNGNPDADIIIPEIEVPGYFATVRSDTEEVLGVVGKDYEVVQNVDAFAFFDAIVEGDGIQYETAGALGKGERIFVTAKLPDYIRVGKEDLIEQYLFLTTSHDGFGSITAAFTPVRIVCANTLNAALKNKTNTIKIRHTANAKERLETAHQLMGITSELSKQFGDIWNYWTKVRIRDEEVKKLITLALMQRREQAKNIDATQWEQLSSYAKNTVEEAFTYSMTNPAQQMETTKGTLFGAYNAVTGYFQNLRAYKNEEAKLKSLLYGGTAQMRAQKTFDLCQKFATDGNSILCAN